MNEERSIARSIARVFAEGYPGEKIEVVTVNDGSTDGTLKEMLRAQAAYPGLVVIDFEQNRGLMYGMAAATLLAHGDILVYVDSDTFLMPGALSKLVQGFIDPTVGGIAGHTDVENADVNVLTKMQDVRYFFSYKVMKAAESVFGMVSCLPGCFSPYRRACVLHVLDDWMNERILGKMGDFADDRSLTNFVLKDYRVLYDDEAL
ncbi:MAG: glycosyltransferase family 2 protein, partial [Kiritimatiellia bacterium]|nr:glycosyltransferase family 2 protein [Kiritimatiellia bacterium]